MTLNESLFDNIELTEITDDIEFDCQFRFDILSAITCLYDYAKNQLKHQIYSLLTATNNILSTHPLIEYHIFSYKIGDAMFCKTNDVNKLSNEIFINRKEIYEKMREIYNEITSDFIFPHIIIDVKLNKDCDFKYAYRLWSNLFHKLIGTISHNADKIYYYSIFVDDCCIFDRFSVKSQNIRLTFTKLFGNNKQTIKIRKPQLSYTGPVNLSEISNQKIKDFKIGSLLYATRDGKLVSQQREDDMFNYPIAVCVIPGTKSAIFSALNIASLLYPKYGCSGYKIKQGFCTFAPFLFNPDKNLIEQLSQIHGYQNQPILYKMMNDEIDKFGNFDENWYSQIISDDHERGTFPTNMITYRYAPIGTTEGNWYIPAIYELEGLFTNLENIVSLIDESLSKYKFSYALKDLVSSFERTFISSSFIISDDSIYSYCVHYVNNKMNVIKELIVENTYTIPFLQVYDA